MSGVESDKLKITVEKQLNLEDYQQINQMKWIKAHWVEMTVKPSWQKRWGQVDRGSSGLVMEPEHLD